MTLSSAIAFAIAFFFLALAPGPGLAAILSRALGSSMRAGYGVTLGLVVGDAIFMGIALLGLSSISQHLGALFSVVKYVGAAYLIYLGYRTWTAPGQPLNIQAEHSPSIWKDIGLGLVVTLGNPKPILFYGALLPTFLDVSKLGLSDFALLISIVIVISALVYGFYMLLAEKSRKFLGSSKAAKRMNRLTGGLLMGSGVLVATR